MRILPRRDQYKNWSLPAKWSFWAAIIGLPLAITSLLLAVFPYLAQDESHLEGVRLRFRVSQEQQYNRYWLRSAAKALATDKPIPVGRLKTGALLKFVDAEYTKITENAYGEEIYIYQLVLTLDDLAGEINKNNSKLGIRDFEARSEFNFHDVIFLNNFLEWYLRPEVEGEEYNKPRNLKEFLAVSNEEFLIAEGVVPKLKYFLYEGVPIKTYSDYLGLID